MRRALLLLTLLAACQRAPEPAPADTRVRATPTPAPTPSATATADLTRYIGKYPSDAVDGHTFIADPLVRAGVKAAVPDADVRARVLDDGAVATPIALEQGRVLSYACEPHNCGPHNWSIALTPDGREAAVCYYDEDHRIARWYPEDFGPAPSGGCPSGDE